MSLLWVLHDVLSELLLVLRIACEALRQVEFLAQLRHKIDYFTALGQGEKWLLRVQTSDTVLGFKILS